MPAGCLLSRVLPAEGDGREDSRHQNWLLTRALAQPVLAVCRRVCVLQAEGDCGEDRKHQHPAVSAAQRSQQQRQVSSAGPLDAQQPAGLQPANVPP